MKIKPILTIAICFALVFIPGCWDRRELNETGLVSGIGVDLVGEDNLLLSAQVILPLNMKTSSPTGSGGAQKPHVVFSASGKSVFQAARQTVDYTSHKLFYGYAEIIVLNEDVVKRYPLDEILDFFYRDPEFRERTWVLVTKDRAMDIMDTVHPLEIISSYAISDEIVSNSYKSKTVSNDLLHVHQILKSDGQDATVSVVTKGSDNRPNISGSAIFKEGKFTAYLTEMESRGLLWVLGKVKSGIVAFPYPDEPENKISIEIIRAHSKIEPFIKDGKIGINVFVEQVGNIGEMERNLDLTEPGVMDKLARIEEKAIKKEIDWTLKKARQYHCDIFGFGNHVHMKYPKEWRSIENAWRDEIFPEMEINVDVKVMLKQIGLSID